MGEGMVEYEMEELVSKKSMSPKGRHGVFAVKLCDPCLSALRYT